MSLWHEPRPESSLHHDDAEPPERLTVAEDESSYPHYGAPMELPQGRKTEVQRINELLDERWVNGGVLFRVYSCVFFERAPFTR